MKAIILAAGRGSRLREKTATIPKCMVELWGKPLLMWQIKALHETGIWEIGIVTGYQSDKIRQAVPNAHFFHNENWEQTNMFASLQCAEEWLKTESCIVSYSDVLYTRTAIQILNQLSASVGIIYYTKFLELWKQRLENPLEDLESFRINEKGELLEIGNRVQSLEEIQGQYMGLLKFTPKGWCNTKRVLQQKPFKLLEQIDMTSIISYLIKQGLNVQTAPCDDFWIEVDSVEDYQLYKRWKLEKYKCLID